MQCLFTVGCNENINMKKNIKNIPTVTTMSVYNVYICPKGDEFERQNDLTW